MRTILVISMFRYAVEKKVKEINKGIPTDNRTFRVVAIKAQPNEIEKVIEGKQFDYAFIDKFYEMDEVNIIRGHITGLQKNQIKRF